LDSNHPAGLPQKELRHWKHEGVIEYLGFLEDIRPAFKDCSV
jgi:hypothetical protein